MPRLMRAVTTRARRRGMTLIEIMISLVLLGIVSGVIMRVIMRQQRFYAGVNQIMTQRGQLRQATSILPIDLRGLSSIGDDILVASDSSIDLMVTVGTGVVCALGGGNSIYMPPEGLANGQTMTSFYGYGLPQKGSIVYIYNDSSIVGNEDDRWQKFTLDNVNEDASKCLLSFGAKAADLGKKRPMLVLKSGEPDDAATGGPLSRYIDIGAPVRILKQVRYALYQAADGQWYLGFAEYNTGAGSYDALAPVSGPYDPYGTASGLGFRYYDVDGNEVASGSGTGARRTIARVDLIARARTAGNVRTAGIQNGASQQYRDSLAVTVMLRNRQ